MNALPHKTIWREVVATLFMLTLATTPQVRAAQAKHLSHKEVNELIASAKEPQDHLRLAQYYNSEADRLEAEAKEHEVMAESYRKAGGREEFGIAHSNSRSLRILYKVHP